MVDTAVDLRQVVVRPIRAEERQAFDRLLIEHHYLKSSVLVGEALRYVATVGERWLALLGWSTASLKCRPRDEWIGWPDRLQWRRPLLNHASVATGATPMAPWAPVWILMPSSSEGTHTD